MDAILFDKRDDGVATVTLNRPQVLNALDVPSKERLGDIWRDAAADRAVRAIVLRGAGKRAFCAGSDIKEINRTGRMVSTETLMDAIPNVGTPLNKPVVAAIHGHCVGFGMTLAIHCDLKLAAPGARFAFPEVKYGMISGVSAVHLPQLVPMPLAMEMLLLGDAFDAATATQRGLINRVVDGDVFAEADNWAGTIASYPPETVQATKVAALSAYYRLQDEMPAIAAARDAVSAAEEFRDGAATFASGRKE